MSTAATTVSEYDVIAQVVQRYIEGAESPLAIPAAEGQPVKLGLPGWPSG